MSKDEGKAAKAFGEYVGQQMTVEKHPFLSSLVGIDWKRLSRDEITLLQVDFLRPESIRNVTAPARALGSSTVPNPPPSIFAKSGVWSSNMTLIRSWWRGEGKYNKAGRKKAVEDYIAMSFEEKKKLKENIDNLLKEQENLLNRLLGKTVELPVHRISIGSESEMFIENEGPSVYELADRSTRRLRSEAQNEDVIANDNEETKLGHSSGAFSKNDTSETITPPRKKAKIKTKHLATRFVLKKFRSMVQSLVDIFNSTSRDSRSLPMNDFLIINCRNIKWHDKNSGAVKMTDLDGKENIISIVGYDYVSIRNILYLVGLAAQGKSTPERQLSIKYVCTKEEESLEDSFQNYFADLEA